MRIYGQHLTQSLSQVIKKQLAAPTALQLELCEELALLRDAAGQTVRLYAVTRELSEREPDNANARSAMLQASSLMREYLAEVVKTCETAWRMENNQKDTITARQLTHFLHLVTGVIYNSCNGDEALGHSIVRQINESVSVPLGIKCIDAENVGTFVQPSAGDLLERDVNFMDESVPRVA